MTFEVVVNPPGGEAAYLAGLQLCFPGAWNPATYCWYFERPFAGLMPDTLAVALGSQLVAGVGINYRHLRLPGGGETVVGILTAAWTLPEHRGRWHFSRLMTRAKPFAREKGCVALLGFVTSGNASAANLKHAGALEVPTYYLLAAPAAPLAIPDVAEEPYPCAPPQRPTDDEDYTAFGFRYDKRSWWQQFVERPNPTQTLSVGTSGVVVETVNDTERLQWISGPRGTERFALAPMLRHARANHRKFFHFTTSHDVALTAADYGVTVGAGAIMILPVADSSIPGRREEWSSAPWAIQSGDRM